MIAEGERFAEEDALHRKKTEALNTLAAFVSGLRAQAVDRSGLGGKLERADRDELLQIVRGGADWVDEQARDASLEDLEAKLAELQNAAGAITSKLYQQTGGAEEEDGDAYYGADENQAEFDADPRDHADL